MKCGELLRFDVGDADQVRQTLAAPSFVMVDRFLGSDGPVTKTGYRVAAT
jgi:hypothetical protein